MEDEWEDVDEAEVPADAGGAGAFAQTTTEDEFVNEVDIGLAASAYLGQGEDLSIDVASELLPEGAGAGAGAGAGEGGPEPTKKGGPSKPSPEARAAAAWDVNLRRTHLLCLLAGQTRASAIASNPRLHTALVARFAPEILARFRGACVPAGACVQPTAGAVTDLLRFFAFLCPLVGDETALTRCWAGYDPDWARDKRRPGAPDRGGRRGAARDDYSLPGLLRLLSTRASEYRVGPVAQAVLWCALLRALGCAVRLVQVHDLLEPKGAREMLARFKMGHAADASGVVPADPRAPPVLPPPAPPRAPSAGGRGGAAARGARSANLSSLVAAVNAGKRGKGKAVKARPAPSSAWSGGGAGTVIDLTGGEGEGGAAAPARGAAGGGAGGRRGGARSGGGGGGGALTIGAAFKIGYEPARKLPGLRTWAEVYARAPPLPPASTSAPAVARWLSADPGRQAVGAPGYCESARLPSCPIVYAFAVDGTGGVVDVTRRYSSHWGTSVGVARDGHGMHGSAIGSVGALAFLAPLQAARGRRAVATALRKGRGGGGAGGAPGRALTHPSTVKEEGLALRLLGQQLGASSDPPRLPGMTWLAHALASASAGTGVGAGAGAGAGGGRKRGRAEEEEGTGAGGPARKVPATAAAVATGAGAGAEGRSAEEAELAALAASSEALPTRLEDFRAHPRYALEEHCGTYEAIHPRTGRLATFKGRIVWPRSHVRALRTAGQWMRQGGRAVSPGQEGCPARVIPAAQAEAERKKAAARRARAAARGGGAGAGAGGSRRLVVDEEMAPEEGGEEEEGEGSGGNSGDVRLYGEWQTDMFVPPPVGPTDAIPTSSYGNFELWHANLLPAGLVHVRGPGVKKAAAALGVPHAPAMLGFERSNGRVTALVDGCVVHEGSAAAVRAAAEESETAKADKAERKRRAGVRERWVRLAAAVATRERLRREYAHLGAPEGAGAGEGGGEEEENEAAALAAAISASLRK